MQILYACNSISGKLSDQHNSVKRASPILVLEVLRPYIIIQSAQLKAPNGRESQSFSISVPIMWPMKPQTAEIQEECKEPQFLELRSSKWFIVSTICVASFSVSGLETGEHLKKPRADIQILGFFHIWSGYSCSSKRTGTSDWT